MRYDARSLAGAWSAQFEPVTEVDEHPGALLGRDIAGRDRVPRNIRGPCRPQAVLQGERERRGPLGNETEMDLAPAAWASASSVATS
jgi:hypothetical protein